MDSHSPVKNAEDFLRVSASSAPKPLASAIAHGIYASEVVKLRAIGAGAVNQAVKAMTIASGYVAVKGLRLYFIPGFTSVDSRDGEITAVIFSVHTF